MFVFAQFLFLLLPPTLSLSLALLSQSARTEGHREKGGERKKKRINWFHFLPIPPKNGEGNELATFVGESGKKGNLPYWNDEEKNRSIYVGKLIFFGAPLPST